MGGTENFREAWRHYYDDAYAFIYVLDSSEEKRLGENGDVLKRLLQEEKVKGKPILMYEISTNKRILHKTYLIFLFCFSLANKQDKAEALDKNTILEELRIERLVNDSETLCRVVKIKKNI